MCINSLSLIMLRSAAPRTSWRLFLHTTFIMTLFTDYSDALAVDRKVYVVYMGDRLQSVSSAQLLHRSMLDQVIGSDASEILVHSYQRSFNGFAAKLSDEEVKKIASMDEVVSVFPSKPRKLHTTRSWDFMGFPTEATRTPFENDVIIGMLDTGIWPESDSFSDEGFGPPPSKWKGTCQSLSNFTCNNKIIGAKYYRSDGMFNQGDIQSPRDSEGHGSHTSSIAAGHLVGGASLDGLAKGTARGGVPSARIAVYKICWMDGCFDADILAAFDDAIADGVDIISLSVGGVGAQDYFVDSIAIGAFHAMKNGIMTSNSAGNSGPGPSTIENYSPWSLTVAASTIDRRFVSDLRLGNGDAYEGTAINTIGLNEMYPMVYAGDAPNISAGYNSTTSRFCNEGSLDKDLVKGKLVLCDGLSGTSGPLLAGAVGAVMQSSIYTDSAFSFSITTTVLGSLDALNTFLYINATRHPKAKILKTQEADNLAAPFVVSFSSRGPSLITKDILKPDLTAPGVDILAAWSPISSERMASYNIISGTSMSCPHATGAAAYIKSFHPTWSPAAIKSALMTTAYPMQASKNIDAEFAYGAGHVNPIAALKPGLIYDAGEGDYVSMLCGQGYSTKNLRLVTGDNIGCSIANNGTVWDLNYPSLALSVEKGKRFSISFKRTVTNVGLPKSTYHAIAVGPSELKISVKPRSFSFKSQMEKQTFIVTVKGVTEEAMLSASLELQDGIHHVRSPIVVYTF